MIFAFAGTLWLLFLSRIIQGLGGGTIGVVQAYVVDISEGKDRAKALGWVSAVTSLGAVVGPAIGSVLVRVGGRTAPGLGSALLCILVSIFAWHFLRESKDSRSTATEEHAAIVPSTGTGAIRLVVVHPKAPASRLILIYAIAIGAFYGTTPLLPLILSDRIGVTETNVGYFIMSSRDVRASAHRRNGRRFSAPHCNVFFPSRRLKRLACRLFAGGRGRSKSSMIGGLDIAADEQILVKH